MVWICSEQGGNSANQILELPPNAMSNQAVDPQVFSLKESTRVKRIWNQLQDQAISLLICDQEPFWALTFTRETFKQVWKAPNFVFLDISDHQ